MVRALIWTVALEGALGALTYPFFRGVSPLKDEIIYNALINTFTNPVMNLLLFGVFGYSPIKLFISEAAVVVTEAVLYKQMCGMKAGNAFVFSALLNAFSFVMGELYVK
ncbi:MAG: hypothetical protein K5629_08190 [Eubacteriales bacterium]|nr:hypothetical protein [Eubacteriales bacterium]